MEVVFFPDEAIRDFLRRYGQGSKSKDYELTMALALKKFCERSWRTECSIGFKIKGGYSHLLPQHGNISIGQVATILRRQRDEDTPFDVVVSRGKIGHTKKRGPAFQIKRFGQGLDSKSTDDLIAFLKRTFRKYGTVNASLVVALETGEEIDFVKIVAGIQNEKIPFVRVMFLALTGGEFIVGEIWPKQGMETFKPEELFS